MIAIKFSWVHEKSCCLNRRAVGENALTDSHVAYNDHPRGGSITAAQGNSSRNVLAKLGPSDLIPVLANDFYKCINTREVLILHSFINLR